MRTISVCAYACALLLTITVLVIHVAGHGRLMEPPNRSSLWRFPQFEQYAPPINYDDAQLFCGGIYTQYTLNGGRCGLCGDSWDESSPRDNEGGGKYGRGIIARKYSPGQTIPIAVELTKSHLGYFEFRLCPHNNPLVPATQECLDQNLLPLGDGSGTRYVVNSWESKYYNTSVILPAGVTCRQCVLQWHYKTANSVGECEDGSLQMGCGNQEIFRGCADIEISA